jgi:hypothetical protein
MVGEARKVKEGRERAAAGEEEAKE